MNHDDGTEAADWKVGLRFHELGRLRSHAVRRAFSSVIRASSNGPQSELLQPDEVSMLEPCDES